MTDVLARINSDQFGATMRWFQLRFVQNDGVESVFSLTFPADSLNPMGFVQGGMISAALDDATSATMINGYGGSKAPLTTDLHMMFHRSLPKGPASVRTKIIRLGNRIATCEGRLFDPEGRLVATLLHSAQPVTPPNA
jgi:uncharacterized protein (TIGR00369 family)